MSKGMRNRNYIQGKADGGRGMEVKPKRHIGVRVKGFLAPLQRLELSLEAREQSALGRGGRWALNTHVLSPQFGWTHWFG